MGGWSLHFATPPHQICMLISLTSFWVSKHWIPPDSSFQARPPPTLYPFFCQDSNIRSASISKCLHEVLVCPLTWKVSILGQTNFFCSHLFTSIQILFSSIVGIQYLNKMCKFSKHTNQNPLNSCILSVGQT